MPRREHDLFRSRLVGEVLPVVGYWGGEDLKIQGSGKK